MLGGAAVCWASGRRGAFPARVGGRVTAATPLPRPAGDAGAGDAPYGGFNALVKSQRKIIIIKLPQPLYFIILYIYFFP